MKLIDQHTKKIMEGCKERARDAGLSFSDETLEYIVTNRDMLELKPKNMIPTLYDYWVEDVLVLQEKGKYELYPNNPYETVINTRPPISFYNDNNPDWLNVMIFYHVIAHIDFFQNNAYFKHTWDYDFLGNALANKRIIAELRSQKGRWVDYVIEFARGIDNLTNYYSHLSKKLQGKSKKSEKSDRLSYYFDVFLQDIKHLPIKDFLDEIERFNEVVKKFPAGGENIFFSEVLKKYPEFANLYEKEKIRKKTSESVSSMDLLQYVAENSSFLNKNENKWMKTILYIVRDTALYFEPQIRTKIMNEGWASFWHEKLFLQDDRIKGNEVDFARINAYVTSISRVGLNPYAIGLRLFQYIKDSVDQGKLTYEFEKIHNIHERKIYNKNTNKGMDYIFDVRANHCDTTFINSFVEQDFIDRFKLFVVGKRLNSEKMMWEYYVKSRSAESYKNMLLESLYHPPYISVNENAGKNGTLYLIHHFEGKELIRDYIFNTMMGLEFLWGDTIKLLTTELDEEVMKKLQQQAAKKSTDKTEEIELKFNKVLYTMANRKLARKALDSKKE